MRSKILAAAVISTCAPAVLGCGGSEPAPQTAPPAPPPVAPTASAAPPPADTTPPPPPKPSLVELIPQTLKGIDEAFNAHDAKKMATYYTEDCAAPLRTWAKGNVVVEESAWKGTMTGDFMNLKASKKPVGQIRVTVMWFND